MRVVCGMSGGVDSSVAAAALVQAGHEVIGMTMRLADQDPTAGRKDTCCSPAEIHRARDVCGRLGIPHYTVDERELFAERVIAGFAADYAAGKTPNPCTRCNQHVKFGPLLRRARALGAERVATGHYARIDRGSLLRAADPDKDQSYFLFAMGPSVVENVWFPLGELTKSEVRARARELGLPNWDAPESQELCFVPSGDHGSVVERVAKERGINADALGPGAVVDERGAVLGEHDGIHRVTVGQRRGLRIPGVERRYVLRVIPERREVVVGGRDALGSQGMTVREVTRLELPPAGTVRAEVQIRHRSPPSPATIEHDGERATVRFDAPVFAVAPGQAAVFYAGDRVLGGGWIDAVG